MLYFDVLIDWSEAEHGVNQLRVIGGVCDCCLRVGLQFYGSYNNTEVGNYLTTSASYKDLRIAMHPVSKVETAEIAKIVENAHRYLQIAFAEELYLYCQANNLNFPELGTIQATTVPNPDQPPVVKGCPKTCLCLA
ncbi:MAG TPA: hypothetical protein VEL11_12010 [Candidatus Bathyarchaeia archaeon]|nr:hypothetical protein [Candidatus Bathyarchaeia archaeon]